QKEPMMPIPACTRSPGVCSTEDVDETQIQDFLRRKLEENQELVEYVAYLESVNEKYDAKQPSLEAHITEQQQANQRHLLEAELAQAKKEATTAYEEVEHLRCTVKEYEEKLKEVNIKSDEWEAEAAHCRRELDRLRSDTEHFQQTAISEASTVDTLRKQLGEQASSRENEPTHQEISSLRKAVLDLRGEVQRQQLELSRGKSPEEIHRITEERDALRQVVAKQRMHLLSKHVHPHTDKGKLKPGLPPLPPGSPPAMPAHVRFEDEGCSTEWVMLQQDQMRSEAPSRTSGSDTPSLPEGRTASAGHSESPMLHAYSEPSSTSEGRCSVGLGRACSHSSGVRTCSNSVHISEQSSGSEGVPALSTSPTPVGNSVCFLPLDRNLRSASVSPRAGTCPRTGQSSVSTSPSINPHNSSSYASHARGFKLNPSRRATCTGYATSSRSKHHPQSRTRSPSSALHHPKKVSQRQDREYAPLIFCIDP
ncbi:hypothetical protein DIPPA_34264, partial [Diplonema papillatum]